MFSDSPHFDNLNNHMIWLDYPRCILLIKPKTRAMSASVSLQGQLIANCYQLQRNATYSSTIKKATFHYHLSARRCLASEDDSCGISPFTLGTCCTHEDYFTTKTAKRHFFFNTDLRGRPGTRGGGAGGWPPVLDSSRPSSNSCHL